MAIKKCKDCGADVSSNAEACPSCGASGKSKSVITAGRLIFDSGLILLSSALTLAITTYQASKEQGAWQQQQGILYHMQLHTSKITLLERMQTQLSEFRHFGFGYAFALASGEESDLDEKASAYYKSLAELQSNLAVAPFFFSNAVRPALDEMVTYLKEHEWAPMIEEPEVTSRVQSRVVERDSMVTIVSRTIRIDKYDILGQDLTAAMARDTSDDTREHALLQRPAKPPHPDS